MPKSHRDQRCLRSGPLATDVSLQVAFEPPCRMGARSTLPRNRSTRTSYHSPLASSTETAGPSQMTVALCGSGGRVTATAGV